MTLVEHSAGTTVPPTGMVGRTYDYLFGHERLAGSGLHRRVRRAASGPRGNAATGDLRGSPSAPGTYTFTVTASNGVGTPATTAKLTVTIS